MLEAIPRAPDRHGKLDETAGRSKPRPWLVGFAILHLACQLLLLIPALSSVRVVLRMAAFGVSTAFLVLIPSKTAWRSPLRACALCILALLGLEFFHPEGSGLLAALAAIMLNLAVLAPIFWVPRTQTSPANLQSLITILWVFYTLSAILGVLQAYFPGQLQPPLSAVLAANSRERLAGLEIELASGVRVFRPMGLTDSPGGAAFAGLYAVLLGTGMLLSTRPPFKRARALATVSILAGLMCLYLCQVRSLLVMTAVCEVTLLALLLLSGRITKLVGMLGAVGALIPVAFALAASIGGKAMTDRLTTLVAADPGTVYYSNRGRFLEATLDRFLPLYPLGAGLGRWGMVHAYFGNVANSLWVEIQLTAWLFDGGVPMIFLYSVALLLASWGCLKVALGHIDPTLSLWGAVIVAYDVGAAAICFNFPLFAGTGGLEFWVLNMAVLYAAYNAKREAPRTRLS